MIRRIRNVGNLRRDYMRQLSDVLYDGMNDELEGLHFYRDLIELAKKSYPEIVDELREIRNDERSHLKILESIRDRIERMIRLGVKI